MERLLELLKANARTPVESLARQLGEPAADVEARLLDYEKLGIFRG